MREFAYGGGLPYSVHPNYQNHVGFLSFRQALQGITTFGKQGRYLIAKIAYKLIEGSVAVASDTLFKSIYHLQGGVHTHIGLHESLFHRVEGIVVHSRFAGYRP